MSGKKPLKYVYPSTDDVAYNALTGYPYPGSDLAQQNNEMPLGD